MVEEQTEYDTIAAISTPPGEGAISIVRLSGDDALPIVMKMFKGKDLTKVPTHTINYGHIIDPKNGETVDEVMVTVMRAPKTYTREDIVEINCHGGIVPTNKILQLLLTHLPEYSKNIFRKGYFKWLIDQCRGWGWFSYGLLIFNFILQVWSMVQSFSAHPVTSII